MGYRATMIDESTGKCAGQVLIASWQGNPSREADWWVPDDPNIRLIPMSDTDMAGKEWDRKRYFVDPGAVVGDSWSEADNRFAYDSPDRPPDDPNNPHKPPTHGPERVKSDTPPAGSRVRGSG